jgi:hypothetical protein
LDGRNEGKKDGNQEPNTQSSAEEAREQRRHMSLSGKMDEVRKLISEIWKDVGLHRMAFKRLASGQEP